jgi:osmotically-inducible protein OsmY
MKYALSCAALFLATVVFAQQQGQPPLTTTPPTFPEGRQTPRRQMPPDTQAPPAQTMSSQQVEGQILQQFREEPTLSGTNIDAKVNDSSVVLSGNADSLAQHDLAIQIAQSNAGGRRIVDRINVKRQT